MGALDGDDGRSHPQGGAAAWERLRSGGAIRAALATGARHAQGRMVLYVVPGEQQMRVAFVCGRRVGGAVERNRARRLLKEAWRTLAPGAQGGFDIVFVARPDIRGARTQDLVRDMAEALARAGVTRP